MAVAPRLAADVLMEISYHLLEAVVNCIITSAVEGGFGDGSGFGGPPGFGDPAGYVLGVTNVDACYVGAQVVVGWGLPAAEVATVTAVDPAGLTITITGLQTVHAVGETIMAPTFPTQAPTDPLWTQTEMLEYLARAQNEFLLRCSCLLQRFPDQLVLVGQQFQPTPATAIELERVAVQDGMVSFAISTISRASGVVTCRTTLPSTFTAGLPVWIDGVLDSSFNSASTLTTDLAVLTSGDGLVLTWAQAGPDATSSLGTVNQLLYPRLYETTQEQIGLANPQWFYDQASPVPTDWYEDRTGKYQWGLAPVPRGNYLVELLASVRGPETLGLLDEMSTASILVPYIKYGAMASAYEKSGEARSPSYAAYCRMRFDMGVLTVQRYLQGYVEPLV